MATGKRASMREGPLAQLFRKTEEEEGRDAAPRSEERPAAPAREPRAGRPLPEGGPSPQVTRQRGPEREAGEERTFEQRATEAARRAEERARRREREAQPERGWSRYEGAPSPEERLRSVFSADIPENILDKAPPDP